MESFRKTKKSTLYLWVILLSVALLSSQSVKLHVHNVGHDHHTHHHPDALELDDHQHVSIAHLSLDDSHSDHHDQLFYESNACPDCLLTKISNNVHSLAVLALLFTLLLFGLCRHVYFSRRDSQPTDRRWPHFTPLLRAPPL